MSVETLVELRSTRPTNVVSSGSGFRSLSAATMLVKTARSMLGVRVLTHSHNSGERTAFRYGTVKLPPHGVLNVSVAFLGGGHWGSTGNPSLADVNNRDIFQVYSHAAFTCQIKTNLAAVR
eukprot:6126152-Prymnesium_polylepis.1